MDTIFAPATAAGKAGVAVVRISGPEAGKAASRLGADVSPGGRGLRILTNEHGEMLDEALVLHFEAGRSFTGDEVVELHIHGSPAILRAILDELGSMDGLRLADPGEFTRRALTAGRMSLSQVEALSDLIEAETEAQRKQAQRVLSGALGEKAEKWRQRLIGVASTLAVSIDFADEDIPDDVLHGVDGILNDLTQDFQKELRGADFAERVRLGFEVAILGPPNAGKSTLLNRLAGRDASITSEYAGTTRDIIELRFDLNGIPVTFLDTAGLHETDNPLESIGIERARDRAGSADLRVFLDDGSGYEPALFKKDDLVVRAKSDLDPEAEGVSGLTGAGVDDLIKQIEHILGQRVVSAGLLIRERHRVGLERAMERLAVARQALSRESVDMAAEDVTAAIRAVDAIVGRVDVESVLDEVFSNFCLGK